MKNTNDQGSLTEALSISPSILSGSSPSGVNYQPTTSPLPPYGGGSGNLNYRYVTPSTCPTCGKCPTCGSYRQTWPYSYPWYPQQTWINASKPTAYPTNITWYNIPASGSAALPATNNTATNNLNQSWTLHSLDANASPPR